jgi:hypothetical protein
VNTEGETMPVVEEFAHTLKRNATPSASWNKVDLHNHSPASHDFRGDRSTAVEDFVQRIRQERIAVVMFTDHERLPDPDFVQAVAKQSGALVLAGLEVNVFVDALGKPDDKVDKNICFHLLIGFDPNAASSPMYWCEHLYKNCRSEERVFGGTKLKGIVAPIDQIMETLRDSGAIVIPAHLHSGKDAYRSRSIDKVFSEAEFLRWARDFFTALDVRSDATAAFFDGKHTETNCIEISCIRSSDAHQASDLGTFPTWVQMERVSFAELKAALELPSRVCRAQPTMPSSYIVGMHVEGHYLVDHWMTFSPHLNVLIGVKGAGKTSILECLRFALGSDVPNERKQEVTKHLNAILGPGGRVRLLLKRDDGALLLVERRVADRTFKVTFDDDRQIDLDSLESLRFPAAVLGWHEIEHAATDRQIRRLHMDAIAGREEVNHLTNEAKLAALSIRQQHDIAAAKYSEYVQLSTTVAQQEAMRQGLQQLNDANLIELRDQMSNALAVRQEIERLREHLRTLPTNMAGRVAAVLQVDLFKLDNGPPLACVATRVNSDLAEMKTSADRFTEECLKLCETKLKSVEESLLAASEEFSKFASDYRNRLNAFPPDVQRLLESHREVLEKTKELPNLKARLGQLVEEIGSDLATLQRTSESVADLLDQRLNLRVTKVAAFNELLRDAGVKLSVAPGTAREDEFAQTFNQFGPIREVFQQLRTSHSNAGRFHRTLAASYAGLRADLMSGDRVMFSRADFGNLITVLENDDLDIRFAVGKPGEQFSPIDQLSAGQRCTAIFPILLKLKDGPLVVDQPEDNLDNRHIAKSVAPVLVEDKRIRQIMLTSHNANLVVLSDPETIAVFEAVEGKGALSVAGFLSHKDSVVTRHVLDILDGGQRALDLRSRKYGGQS